LVKAKALIIGGLTGIALAMPSGLFAFVSTQVEQFTARVVVGGLGQSESLRIKHTPLQGISSVTEEAIIQGEAGTSPPNVPTPFPARITPEDPPLGGLPTGADIIRVTVQYRVGNPDGTWQPIVTLPQVEGPDPLPFAFQIDPSEIQDTPLQYKIIAERLRLDDTGTALVVVSTRSYPAGAHLDPNIWVTVGVAAQAANVVSGAGGRVVIPDGNPNDGETYVDIPAHLFSSPALISLNELPLGGEIAPFATLLSGPLAMYEFSSDQPFSGTLKASFLYQDFQYPVGQDGILDGTTYPESLANLVWWDGHIWRALGSQKNPDLNTLTARITSDMKLIAIVPASGVSPDDSRPREKVITPNGDGNNDILNFGFFDAASDIRVEIFDITGRRIRSLSAVGTTAWDGRNDSGEVVESGVYIYQYTDGGKRITGLVAVAK
jgi:gliding motility-associated-like protein